MQRLDLMREVSVGTITALIKAKENAKGSWAAGQRLQRLSSGEKVIISLAKNVKHIRWKKVSAAELLLKHLYNVAAEVSSKCCIESQQEPHSH